MQTHVEKIEASKNAEIEAQVRQLRDALRVCDEAIRMTQMTETDLH